MSAIVICNPAWSLFEIERTEHPVALVKALVSIMERDGAESACDNLCEYGCWQCIDEETSDVLDEADAKWSPVVVKGYGIAYDDFLAGSPTGDFEYAIGIMCDGFVFFTDFARRESVPVDMTAKHPFEKIEQLVNTRQ